MSRFIRQHLEPFLLLGKQLQLAADVLRFLAVFDQFPCQPAFVVRSEPGCSAAVIVEQPFVGGGDFFVDCFLPAEEALNFFCELRAIQLGEKIAATHHLAVPHRDLHHVPVDAGEDVAPLRGLQLAAGGHLEVSRDEGQRPDDASDDGQNAGGLEQRPAAE